MELTAYHIIQQQVFDIYTKRKDRYALLQSRFSRLFNNELFPLLETFIDREIPANFNFRIETMTVDLGTVRYEYLEQDITRIFIECFKKALHEITGDISVSGSLPVTTEVTNDQTDRRLEIMEFFLFTGTLPWWAATENYAGPLSITDELLLHKKYEFRELLNRIGDNETVRKRLAWQFPETYIRAVVKILEPDKAGFIFQYHNEVTALQEDQQFVQSEAKEFEKAIWLFVLDYLLVDRGSIFEERSFVKSSLYKMSMFFNVQYEELLIAFYKAVQMVPPSLKRSGGLGLIIEYVYNDHFFKQEQDEKGTDTTGNATDDDMHVLNQVRWIEYFLTHGTGWELRPAGGELTLAEPAFITRELMIRWLHGLIEKMPSFFAAKLKEWVRQQPLRQKRLFELMDAGLLKKLSTIMAEEHRHVVNRYFDLLRLIYKEGGAADLTIADNTFIYQSAFGGIMLLKQDNISIAAFIKKHLQAVSAHYNIDAEKLAKALLQVIIQEHGKSSHHAELLAGITALLKPEELCPTYPGNANEVLHMYPDRANEVWHTLDPADSTEWLPFYIHYGFLPWWAPWVDEKRIFHYIDELIAKEPVKAAAIFKPSLKSDVGRRRLMMLFSPTQMLGWFKNISGIREGVKAYEELLGIVKRSFTPGFITVDKAEKLMMLLMLEEIGKAGDTFDVSRFILTCKVRLRVLHKQLVHADLAGQPQNEWQKLIDELTGESATTDMALPETILPKSDNEKHHLLRSLLLTAYRKDVAGVRELLRSLPVESVGFKLLYQLFSKAATIEERSLFYLIRSAAEKKLLHWWQQAGVNVEANASENLQEVIDAVMTHERGEVFTRLLKKEVFLNWLLPVSLPYIPDRSVDGLLEIMLPGTTRELKIFIREFRTLLRQTKLLTIDNTALIKLYRLFLFDLLSGKINAYEPVALIKAFFDFGERIESPLMFRFYGSLSGQPVADAEKQSKLSFLWPRLKQEIIQRIELHSRKFAHPGKGSTIVQKDQSSDALLLLQIKNELNRKQKEEEKMRDQPNYPALKEPEVEKIYVPNAGLVLLYPFYATYFGRLGLLEQGKFIDPRAHQRAVHLMAFIADGKEEHAEHTLPLNKILCGFPVKEPVEHAFSIQEHERALTVQMLNVVFQRWEKLKNSSVEGFRDSFLKRQGMLTRTGEGWNLRVEQRGYDILLDTIPWGFRFIRSSWMDTILTVEWI